MSLNERQSLTELRVICTIGGELGNWLTSHVVSPWCTGIRYKRLEWYLGGYIWSEPWKWRRFCICCSDIGKI